MSTELKKINNDDIIDNTLNQREVSRVVSVRRVRGWLVYIVNLG